MNIDSQHLLGLIQQFQSGEPEVVNSVNTMLNSVIESYENLQLIIDLFQAPKMNFQTKYTLSVLIGRFYNIHRSNFSPNDQTFLIQFLVNAIINEDDKIKQYLSDICANMVANNPDFKQLILEIIRNNQIDDLTFEYLFDTIAQHLILEEFAEFLPKLLELLIIPQFQFLSFTNLLKASYFLGNAQIILPYSDHLRNAYFSILQSLNTDLIMKSTGWKYEIQMISVELSLYITPVENLHKIIASDQSATFIKFICIEIIYQELPFIIKQLSLEDVKNIFNVITQFFCYVFINEPDFTITSTNFVELIKFMPKNVICEICMPAIEELAKNQDLIYILICITEAVVEIIGKFDGSFDIFMQGVQFPNHRVRILSFYAIHSLEDFYTKEISENEELVAASLIEGLTSCEDDQEYNLCAISLVSTKTPMPHITQSVMEYYVQILQSNQYNQDTLWSIFTFIAAVNEYQKILEEEIFEILTQFLDNISEEFIDAYLTALSTFIDNYPDHLPELFEPLVSLADNNIDSKSGLFLMNNIIQIFKPGDSNLAIFEPVVEKLMVSLETIEDIQKYANILKLIAIYATKLEDPESLVDFVTSHMINVIQRRDHDAITTVAKIIDNNLKDYISNNLEKIEETHFYSVVEYIAEFFSKKQFRSNIDLFISYEYVLVTFLRVIGIAASSSYLNSIIQNLTNGIISVIDNNLSQKEYIDVTMTFLFELLETEQLSDEDTQILLDFSMHLINADVEIQLYIISFYRQFLSNRKLNEQQISLIFQRSIEIIQSEMCDALPEACLFISSMSVNSPALIVSPYEIVNLLVTQASQINDNDDMDIRDTIVYTILQLYNNNILGDIQFDQVFSTISPFLPAITDYSLLERIYLILLANFEKLSQENQIALLGKFLFVFSLPSFNEFGFEPQFIAHFGKFFSRFDPNEIQSTIISFGLQPTQFLTNLSV